ncbi:hypothetical protein QQG55_39150 [Brugia pahangi]
MYLKYRLFFYPQRYGSATFKSISRISELIRDILIAMVVGATPLANALFFSFRLANLLRVFFAERPFTLFYIRYIQQNHMIIKRHLGLRIAQYLSRLIFY